jgi:hypothetical protein
MQGFIESGRAVDLVLAVIAIEFTVLALRRRKIVDLVCALGPGVFLLLALRAALTNAGWMWVALFVSLSFPLHLADLARRR